MRKLDFMKFLKEQVGDLPINKQEKELEKISGYVDEYIQKIKKNKTQCKSCGKWSPTKDFKTEKEIASRVQHTYSDAGYGDDDKYGEVEYLYTYQICPLCKEKQVADTKYLRTKWEKRYNE